MMSVKHKSMSDTHISYVYDFSRYPQLKDVKYADFHWETGPQVQSSTPQLSIEKEIELHLVPAYKIWFLELVWRMGTIPKPFLYMFRSKSLSYHFNAMFWITFKQVLFLCLFRFWWICEEECRDTHKRSCKAHPRGIAIVSIILKLYQVSYEKLNLLGYE